MTETETPGVSESHCTLHLTETSSSWNQPRTRRRAPTLGYATASFTPNQARDLLCEPCGSRGPPHGTSLIPLLQIFGYFVGIF